MNPSNTLYTSYTFANELNGTSDDNTIDSAVYTLSDPDEMDEFLEGAEKLIDTDTFSLQSNDSMYQSMLEPLNNVASFSKNVVLLVAVAGITEVAICMILALGVASISGNVVANAVGQQLLDQQTETTTQDQQAPGGGQMPDNGQGGQRGGQQGNTNNPFAVSDQVSELEINVKPTQLGLLAGVAFGISLLSVFLASIGILRLNPRKILLN